MFDDSKSSSAQSAVKSLARLAAEEAFSAPREAPTIERIPEIARPALPVAEPVAEDTAASPSLDGRAPRVFRVAPATVAPADGALATEAAERAAPPAKSAKAIDTRKPGPVHVVYNAPARPAPVIVPAAAAAIDPTKPRDDDARIQAGLDRALASAASSEFKDVARRLAAVKRVLETIDQARSFRLTAAP